MMKRIRAWEVANFFRCLHTMFSSGISLPDSLIYLEKGEPNPAFRKVLGDCLGTLLKGYPLSVGMGKHLDVFGTFSVEIVANGETTGSLSSVLGLLCSLQERSQSRIQRIRAALAYPMCLFAVMALVVFTFVIFVAPGDEGLFKELGDDLPWPSQVLITISNSVSNPWLVLGSAAVLATVVMLFRRTYHDSKTFRLLVDSRLLDLPLVGRLLTRLDTARTMDSLATSMEVGVPILRALKNGGRVVVNESFRRDLHEATLKVMDGASLGVSLEESTKIPRFATSMISVGEEAGDLVSILQRIASMLDEEVNEAVDRLVLLVEPLLLTVGGLAAGFVAVATLLPAMRLISEF